MSNDQVFFCGECGGPFHPLTPVESWDGPLPFPIGRDSQAMWARYVSPCGHSSFVRADGGELDPGITQEKALNEPSNELTIFGEVDE